MSFSYDMQVGLLIGNLGIVHSLFDRAAAQVLRFIIDFGMICYMFVLGIEMDPYVLLRAPTREAKVAYAGVLSTFIMACSITPFLNFPEKNKTLCILALSTSLSSTASPVLTRLITSCKIGKSDIGRLVIAAGMHSDFISTLLLSIGYIVFPIRGGKEPSRKIGRPREIIEMSSALVLQILVSAKVSPVVMNWVNNENPPGKPMKGTHLVLSIAFMVLVCSCSTVYGYSSVLSAFVAGIFFPSDGRVSKWVISCLVDNYFSNIVF
jgi:Kef-type K+ transport system membrane component KefB